MSANVNGIIDQLGSNLFECNKKFPYTIFELQYDVVGFFQEQPHFYENHALDKTKSLKYRKIIFEKKKGKTKMNFLKEKKNPACSDSWG